MRRDYVHALSLVAIVWIFFKSVPFFAGLHTYYTWEANYSELILIDGTQLNGSVRYDNMLLTFYRVDDGNQVKIVPVDSVRIMSFYSEKID